MKNGLRIRAGMLPYVRSGSKIDIMKKNAQYSAFAELYDTLMDDVDYDRWASQVEELIARYSAKKDRPLRLLDCASGTGAFAIRFAKAGFQVTASDISEEMLRVGMEKARLSGLNLPFIRMDMREITLHRKQDVINCCCDGVNYLTSLEDVAAFFQSAHRNLVPDGILLFDISSAFKLSDILGNNSMGEDREDCTYLWENAFDADSRILEMDLHFFVRSEKDVDLWKRFDETHIQRAHTEEEIIRLAEKNGFDTLSLTDAETGERPKADSERLQFVLRRIENE